MEIIHVVNGSELRGHAKGHDPRLLLTNDRGYYVHPLGEPASMYDGFVQDGWRLIARCAPESEPVRVRNELDKWSVTYADGTSVTGRLEEERLLLDVTDALLDLDMRPLNDCGEDDRHYEPRREGDVLVIQYRRRDQQRTLRISGLTACELQGEWHEVSYPYDARRGERPSRWVYRLGKVSGKLSITSGTTRKETEQHPTVQHEEASSRHETRSPEATLSLHALHALLRKGRILAGLPWFGQVWSRDELLSLGALASGNRAAAKEILTAYWLQPPSTAVPGGRRAADAQGWLAFRTEQLLDDFTALERAFLAEQVARMVAATPLQDGLVVNGPGETWMDTIVQGDDRRGARIEIQALHLALLRLLERLDPSRAGEAARFAQHVKERFFDQGRDLLLDGIVDGVPDATVRPNLFIAYYVAPELLTPGEWRRVFDTALKKLWLSWGGLSSLEPENPLFQPRYTGMGDASYHRGDSWYWLNALAALCLQQLDAARWRETITRLREACVGDLLWRGALGHASELSSAAVQEWGGCFAQAWSAAMLYELLTE